MIFHNKIYLSNADKAFILTGLFLVLFGATANSFTDTTNKYLGVKTFPEQECQEKFLEGITAPSDPQNWITTPDYQPQNLLCLNNDPNCATRQLALKYKQQAKQAQDPCTSAKNKGTMTFFLNENQSQLNWREYPEACKTEIAQLIERNIVEMKQDWAVTRECALGDQNTIAISITSSDLNNISNNNKGFWEYEQATTGEKEDLNALKATASELLQITKAMEGTQPTQQEIEMTIATIKAYNRTRCSETTKSLNDYYVKYKNLSPQAKECLGAFLSNPQPTQPYLFMQQCSALGGQYAAGNPTTYGQYAYYAQYVLEEYAASGFADRQCQQYSTNTLQQIQDPTAQTASIPVCYFQPKNLSGCQEYFTDRETTEAQASEDATANAIFLIIVVSLISGIIIFMWWTSG